MTFYVPYNLINQFNQKDGNSYRHTLSHRVYLYLIFRHSGRIKWDDRKEIVQFLDTSHTALANAIKYLVDNGLIKVAKGWIQAKGKKSFGKSPYNVRFAFSEEDIKSAKKFTNKLFTCICQTSAMLYGKAKKVERVLFPQPKLQSDGVMPKGETEEKSSGFSVIESIEYIQNQSATYIAKMMGRHPMTSYKKSWDVRKDNAFKSNPEMQYQKSGTRTPLTVDGFSTRHYAKVYSFLEKPKAEKFMGLCKDKYPGEFKACYVMEDRHGQFAIVRPVPYEHIFSIDTKPEFKNFDLKFKKLL